MRFIRFQERMALFELLAPPLALFLLFSLSAPTAAHH